MGLKTFVAGAFVITAESMSPTLQPGDRILVDKLWFSPHNLKRNSMVVYHSDGPQFPPFTKRVIGLSGDVVEVKNEVVYVNGEKFNDKHADLSGTLSNSYPELVNCGPATVPLDSCFLLGDNRRNSYDSRSAGPIPVSELIGKANMIYWSREIHFPFKWDKSRYELGAICWDRIGKSL